MSAQESHKPAKEKRSVRDHVSRLAIDHAVTLKLGKGWRTSPGEPGKQVPVEQGATHPNSPKPSSDTLPICIVGSGAAGLYAALILQSLGLSYEILEAQPNNNPDDDRVGGRIYTYRFNGQTGLKAHIGDPARYDYIDMGAMRFPHYTFQQRVFDLFKYVEISDLVIPYGMSNDNAIDYYNGVRVLQGSPSLASTSDIFKMSSANPGGLVDPNYLSYQPTPGGPTVNCNDGEYWMHKAYGPFVQAFEQGTSGMSIKAGWAKAVVYDPLTARVFLTLKDPGPDYQKYPPEVVEWLEMMNTGVGQAFLESLLDALDFDNPWAKTVAGTRAGSVSANGSVDWFCLDGGSDRLIYGMLDKIKAEGGPAPVRNARVTSIAPASDGKSMLVQVEGQSGTTSYSQVICTTPLGCLASIDVSECQLSVTQKVAIRSLGYDASTKVAIKFPTRWWEDPKVMESPILGGGVTHTDLPLRVIVYPSYGTNQITSGVATGVIIVSYTWAQDARRIGSISGPESIDTLIELVLGNLATIHNVTRDQMGKPIATKVINWDNEPYARGAFALFGPNQFGQENGYSLFASLKSPAAYGRLHFAGEATSIHHAWVLGALNSAWRAVYNALANDPNAGKLRQDLIDKWLVPDEEELYSLTKLAHLGSHGKM
ncbi:hypothetical protein FRB96_002138 [Tulasnella sp. 330]|nr:hypothetical protein FRB96_002138 [Tulasnella sp. 330]